MCSGLISGTIEHMINLPKQLTTVTFLSRLFALIFFVTFPILGFILGIKIESIFHNSVSVQTCTYPIQTNIKESNTLRYLDIKGSIQNEYFSESAEKNRDILLIKDMSEPSTANWNDISGFWNKAMDKLRNDDSSLCKEIHEQLYKDCERLEDIIGSLWQLSKTLADTTDRVTVADIKIKNNLLEQYKDNVSDFLDYYSQI